jgi:hypothetical protein
MSTSPSPAFAFAELAPHSIQIAVISGRRLVSLRAFSLDAKADIAAFVSEQGITGSLRSALLSGKASLQLSGNGDARWIRKPEALLAQAKKTNPLFTEPVAVAVDAASGMLPDVTQSTPWILAAVDGASHTEASQLLSEFGLAPAELTLAAPLQLGAVAASLSPGETALVVMPGDDEATLAWVNAKGVVDVAAAPVGYAAIYDAVQAGLGLKFKAAAGKLLYNENYDFSEAAPKIGEALAAGLRPVLSAKTGANLIHLTGLTSCQTWLVESLAKALGLGVWTPPSEKLLFGLDANDIMVTSSAAGVLRMAAQGSGNAPWVQASLNLVVQRSSGPAAPSASAQVAAPSKPAGNIPARPVQAVAIPAAKAAPVAKPPVRPALSASVSAASVAVESVSFHLDNTAPVAASAAGKKSNKGPILIASAVGVVAAVVGLAMHFRSSAPRPEAKNNEPAQVEQAAPVAEQPRVGSGTSSSPAPMMIPQVAPAAAVANPKDVFSADSRRFGNDRYRFEITEKGVIQALATARDEVLVESAAGISLQGSYVGTDGRRKWFNVGGVDDAGYQATVSKLVRGGVTVFDVKVTHPRFELTQTFECLPETIKVGVKFTPINLRDPRGVIAAVHSVRFSPVALNPSLRMRASADAFSYAMKSGTLRVGFNSFLWARDGADSRQTIIAGENGVAFHFTDSTEAGRNILAYEIVVP